MTEPRFKNISSIPWRFIFPGGIEKVVSPGEVVTGDEYFQFLGYSPLKHLVGPRQVETQQPERRHTWQENRLARMKKRELERERQRANGTL